MGYRLPRGADEDIYFTGHGEALHGNERAVGRTLL
jgi:hypothetical protein